MDSSSIVSFTNDSTFQSTLKGDYNNVSVHELALHAMRDRCLLLQRRINTLENDNMKLKLEITKASENSRFLPLQGDEKFNLQQKILDLTKQKSQLSHYVFMVSCENKSLWNKIANFQGAKISGKDLTKYPLYHANEHSTPKTSSNYQEKFSESSLEEISLKLINSYIQEKSQLLEQYDQMSQLQHEDNIFNLDSIGFTYIEDPAMDSLKEIYVQTEKLQKLKTDLAQQENDLKQVISNIEASLQGEYKCPTCIANKAKVITSEHKEIETSDSLVNFATPVSSNTYPNNFSVRNMDYKNTIDPHRNENIVEYPNMIQKVCPMCAEVFDSGVEFAEFQTHVENHFLGETELDSVVDNYHHVPNSINNDKLL